MSTYLTYLTLESRVHWLAICHRHGRHGENEYLYRDTEE